MNLLNIARAGLRAGVIVFAFAATSLWAAGPDGRAVYEARCATCHDNPGTQARLPARGELAARSPESIVSAMFEGAVNGRFRAYSTRTGDIIWELTRLGRSRR